MSSRLFKVQVTDGQVHTKEESHVWEIRDPNDVFLIDGLSENDAVLINHHLNKSKFGKPESMRYVCGNDVDEDDTPEGETEGEDIDAWYLMSPHGDIFATLLNQHEAETLVSLMNGDTVIDGPTSEDTILSGISDEKVGEFIKKALAFKLPLIYPQLKDHAEEAAKIVRDDIMMVGGRGEEACLEDMANFGVSGDEVLDKLITVCRDIGSAVMGMRQDILAEDAVGEIIWFETDGTPPAVDGKDDDHGTLVLDL